MNKEKIMSILGSLVGIGENELSAYSMDTKLTDLGLDSIKFIQFVVEIENEFGIEILDSDLLLSNFETLENLFSTLEKYFNERFPVKKVIVCDCDNVLWMGIAGEEKTHIEKSNQVLHDALSLLYKKGVLICLCSKNDEADIDKAFNDPNMKIQKDKFIASKINFEDKVTNLKEISSELNLSLDSFVFLDDSDYELGLVNTFLPEVYTIKADYNNLSFIDELENIFSSNESNMDRTKLYKEQKNREKEKNKFTSIDDYNESLQTKIVFHYDIKEESPRVSELSQRTNQFNLSGHRYSTEEIESIAVSVSLHFLTLSVSDKYGDMGIIGAAIYEQQENAVIIRAFYLSCRAFGRKFENCMIDEIKKVQKDVYGIYKETEKNIKYKLFYPNNGVKLL